MKTQYNQLMSDSDFWRLVHSKIKIKMITACTNFEKSTSTSSATICIHCGREKFEHLNIEK